MAKTGKTGTITPSALLTWAGFGLLRVLTWLPVPWLLALGRLSGDVLYRALPGRRLVVETNLRLCFPGLDGQARSALAKSHFRSLGMGLFETALGWWASSPRLAGRLQVNGAENLRAAQARGKGVILLSGHFTPIEMIGRLFGEYADAIVTYREQSNPAVDALLLKYRSRWLEGVIHRRDVRGMIRALRKGRTVWYASDQDYGPRRSVFAPFFGIQAATITAIPRLAKMTGSPVVPYYMRRDEENGGRYVVDLLPALENFPCGDDVADATRMNAMLEQAIEKCPEQYFWVHRRFKTRPPGEADLYGR